MSRHLVIDRPNLQVVLGFDHMLRSFFGQVFDPSKPHRSGIAVAGWPTRSGLGTRRPARTLAEARADTALLTQWALQNWPHAGNTDWEAYLGRMREVLLHEWDDGADGVSPEIPASLRGEA